MKRSLKELQFYQNTYPSAYSTHYNTIQHNDDDDDGDDNKFQYWSPSTEKLKPLFEAYDTREYNRVYTSSSIVTVKHCLNRSIHHLHHIYPGIGELEDTNKQLNVLIESYKQKVSMSGHDL